MKTIFYLALLVILYFVLIEGKQVCFDNQCHSLRVDIPIEIGGVQIK